MIFQLPNKCCYCVVLALTKIAFIFRLISYLKFVEKRLNFVRCLMDDAWKCKTAVKKAQVTTSQGIISNSKPPAKYFFGRSFSVPFPTHLTLTSVIKKMLMMQRNGILQHKILILLYNSMKYY